MLTFVQPEHRDLTEPVDPPDQESSIGRARSLMHDMRSPAQPPTPHPTPFDFGLIDPYSIFAPDRSRVPGATFSFRRNGPELLISINGEFDLAGVIQIGEELLEATSGSFTSLTLHLRGVEFIDSSGAATIAEIASRLGAEGKPIKLRSATRSVFRVLRILGVDQLMSLDPHLHEWRPMIPSAPSEARRSPTYAYVRADKAGEIAARNQDCSEQTDQASIRKIALAASSRDREKAPSAG